MALRIERQSARMSKIKNSGLDQYEIEPFEQQQFGTAGIEGVKDTANNVTETKTAESRPSSAWSAPKIKHLQDST